MVASNGTLISSAFDGGTSTPPWQAVFWDATAPNGTSACVATRSADSVSQLATAAWSGCYAASGASFTSESRRWIQYRVQLASTDPSATPTVRQVSVAYAVSSSNPTPTVTALTPMAVSAGGPDFTLTVDGSSFVPGATVHWNGAARPTTFVSATQLTAAIAAADVAAAATVTVTAVNPSPGGGESNALTVVITSSNPQPATTGLSPATALVGDGDLLLTVTGSGFIPASTVRWNGADRTTTFVSANQLLAMIPAADLSAVATVQVTVYTPAPGGGTSNAQTFSVTTAGVLFSDDFTRADGTPDPLSPWVASMGTWSVTGGALRGTGATSQYSYATLGSAPVWTDYSVQGRVTIPSKGFGGGIGGRVDPGTGAHYGVWMYPAGSSGGSNLVKLWKYRSWTDLGPTVPMQQVSVPAVGTAPHTLKATFMGNRILVYYDGTLIMDVIDDNFDGRAPYLSGGISADWWTGSPARTMVVDDILVTTP
jgi:hypothetical protein